MKIVTMYEADDGERFCSEALCLEYEQQCADLAAANNMLDNGATLMAALTTASGKSLVLYTFYPPMIGSVSSAPMARSPRDRPRRCASASCSVR